MPGSQRRRAAPAAAERGAAAPTEAEETATAPTEAEDETPLFMSRPPAGAHHALDALGALIDEEEDEAAAEGAAQQQPAQARPERAGRKRAAVGEMQVRMALLSGPLGDASEADGSAPPKRMRRSPR